jgi:hypothetical protein
LQRLAGWVFYPWLLTLYPIIYLYSVNLASIREDDVLEVVLVALAAVTVVYAVLYLLLRDPYKTGGVTGVMVLVFLTYGHIYNNLDSTSLGQDLLMPVMLVLAAVLIYFTVRSKTLWQQLAPYLNLIFAVLVLMPSWSVVDYFVDKPPVGATALANPLERVVSTEKLNNSPERPDIYYIILDGYSSNTFWMREYGYDNSDFTEALEEHGFYVAYDSQSNYGVTLVSLPSALNMRMITTEEKDLISPYNLPDTDYLRSLIAHNRVADEFQQRGYTYVYLMSGFLTASLMADMNIAFYPAGPRTFSGGELIAGENTIDLSGAYKLPFWSFFLKTTLFRSFAQQVDTQKAGEPYPIYSTHIFQATLDELAQIPALEEATFTFAHLTKPHTPIQYDREGNLLGFEVEANHSQCEDYFFDELHYLNTRILALVEEIIAESSVPPIIILQGDHDSALGHTYPPFCLYGFDIFNAYYLPGGEDVDGLERNLQPVNSFRMILNHYFDADYDLLPQERYIINACRTYDLLGMVAYVDDTRINVALGDYIALLYNATSDDGAPEVQVYAVAEDGSKGDFVFAIPSATIEPYIAAPPEENTIIAREGLVALSALTSGEFQFNIGPDAEGREWAVVVGTFPAQLIHGYEVGVK